MNRVGSIKNGPNLVHSGGANPGAGQRHTRVLRCLLISPIPPIDPFSGDQTYTLGLMESPPPNVIYADYASAQEDGFIVDAHRLRRMMYGSWYRRDSLRIALARSAMHHIRKTGFLLYEDWKFFRILEPFDLIHVHCFPTVLTPEHIPIILSDTIGNDFYLEKARGYSKAQILQLYSREKWLLNAFGAYHPTLALEKAAKVILQSEYGKRRYLQRGVPEHKLAVIPPSFPQQQHGGPAADGHVRFLFIANAFALKGGHTLYAAWREVRRQVPSATLTVVSNSSPPAPDGVTIFAFVPRDILLRDFYPHHDIYVLPSNYDCFSLTPMEAVSFGIPCIVSNITSFPDQIPDGKAGFNVPPEDTKSLADRMILLAEDIGIREELRMGAISHFNTNYSHDVVLPRLRAVYDDAIRGRG